MVEDKQNSVQTYLQSWVLALTDIPWLQIVTDLWKLLRKVIRGNVNEGVYEVLEYTSTLEILDRQGKTASFLKHKQVRYLQDNIIAYQDYAWGDGKILLNYRTSRGIPVDQYRSGYKTYILLSLREVKNRGAVDEFDIQWNIRQGFLTKDGYWATDISNRTKHLMVNVIFPKNRPPTRVIIEESNRKRTRSLGTEAINSLPDGRWQVTWTMDNPRLYEIYVLRWNW